MDAEFIVCVLQVQVGGCRSRECETIAEVVDEVYWAVVWRDLRQRVLGKSASIIIITSGLPEETKL